MEQEKGYIKSLVMQRIGELNESELSSQRRIERLKEQINIEEQRLSDVEVEKKELLNYLRETGHTPRSKGFAQ